MSGNATNRDSVRISLSPFSEFFWRAMQLSFVRGLSMCAPSPHGFSLPSVASLSRFRVKAERCIPSAGFCPFELHSVFVGAGVRTVSCANSSLFVDV